MVTDLTLKIDSSGEGKVKTTFKQIGDSSKKASDEVKQFGETTEKAKRGLDKVAESAGGVAKDFSGLGTSAQGAESKLAKLSQLSMVAQGLAGMGRAALDAAAALGDLALAGSEIQALDAAFDQLGGTTQDLDELREATAGLIKDSDLKKFSNMGQALGIAGDDIKDLMKIATGASQLLGQDVAQLADNIISGTARGSVLILDNLGISLKAIGEIHGGYAKKMGKAVEDLSAEEKNHALTLELTAKASKQLAGVEIARMAEVDRGATSLANLTDKLSVMVAEQVGASGALEVFGQVVEGVSTFLEENSEGIGEFASAIGSTLGPALGGIMGVLAEALPRAMSNLTIAFQVIAPFVEIASVALVATAKAMGAVLDAAEATGGVVMDVFEGVSSTVGGFFETSEFSAGAMEAFAEETERAAEREREFASAGAEATQAQEALGAATIDTSEAMGLLHSAFEDAGTSSTALITSMERAAEAMSMETDAANRQHVSLTNLENQLIRVAQAQASASGIKITVDGEGAIGARLGELSDIAQEGIAPVEEVLLALQRTGQAGAQTRSAGRAIISEYLTQLDEIDAEVEKRKAKFIAAPLEDVIGAENIVSQQALNTIVERRGTLRGELEAFDKMLSDPNYLESAAETDAAFKKMDDEATKRAGESAKRRKAALKAQAALIQQGTLDNLDEWSRKLAEVDIALEKNLKIAGRNARAVTAAQDLAANARNQIFSDQVDAAVAEMEEMTDRSEEATASFMAAFGTVQDSIVDGFNAVIEMAPLVGEALDMAMIAPLLELNEVLQQTSAEFNAMFGSAELSSGGENALLALGVMDDVVNALAESAKAGADTFTTAMAVGKAATGLFVNDVKAQATIMALFEVAESIKAFASGNIPGGIGHGLAAVKYGIVAGTSVSKPSATSDRDSRQKTEGRQRISRGSDQQAVVNQNFFSALDSRPPGAIVIDAANRVARDNTGDGFDGRLMTGSDGPRGL